MTSVAAVVVRWKNGDEIRRCLQSLIDLGGDCLQRIILVDSGSGDGGAERLRTDFPDVDVVALEENLGFAHAVNRGAANADEPLLMVLNPDTEVRANAIDSLAGVLDERPATAASVPLLESVDGSSQHEWQLRRLPTPLQLALGRSGAPQFSNPPATILPVEQPAAAAWLVRRQVWDAIGGLDAGYVPAWWEDVDFCARLQGRLADPEFSSTEGFVVEPRARFTHVGGSSVKELDDATFLVAYYRNLLRYAAQHHPDHFRTIRAGLRLSLKTRGILRPGRRQAYATVLDALR